jgi:hypothetical protein
MSEEAEAEYDRKRYVIAIGDAMQTFSEIMDGEEDAE